MARLALGHRPCRRDPHASATRRRISTASSSPTWKLDGGGPITAQALEDGDIDVGLLFTGSSMIPKGTVLLADDKGLQPADNPVLLVRKDKATPALMKIANAVSRAAFSPVLSAP